MNWRKQDLTYCSNVHPAETLASLNTVIQSFVNRVRLARSLDSMGAGLWLSAAIAEELIATPAKCLDFRNLLLANNLRLFTLNGFPFGNFHAAAVKERVYTPDWSQPERYLHTQNLANILAFCLPGDIREGTISTLPLGYRHAWSQSQQSAAARALCKLADWLAELQQTSGRSIRVCLEMEPDCVLETSEEMVVFFRDELPAQASGMGIDASAIKNHLGVCFDICHQAVMFEDVGDAMARFLAADISIGKIQISSALQLEDPAQPLGLQLLKQFVEPRYLHQVRSLRNNMLVGAIDLDIALESNGFPKDHPWRIHFHVPIQAAKLAYDQIGTTQDAIIKVLDFLKLNHGCRPHLEVETYTWQVLPTNSHPLNDQALIAGLTAELSWLEQAMMTRGLLA